MCVCATHRTTCVSLANVPAGVGIGIPRDDDECTDTCFLQLELESKTHRQALRRHGLDRIIESAASESIICMWQSRVGEGACVCVRQRGRYV